MGEDRFAPTGAVMLSILFQSALLAATAQPVAPGAASSPSAPLAAIHAVCTPTTVAFNGAPPQRSAHAIVDALNKAGPGSLIEVQAGVYDPFSIGFTKDNGRTVRSSGGLPGQPILVRGNGAVTIAGSRGSEALTITQAVRNGQFTFEGVNFECGYRAAIMFYKCSPSELHEGFRFIDCNIVGGFDHATGQGRPAKWGVWGHSLKDFEFRGVRGPAVVRNIRSEHGFYLQNARGDITIENVHAYRLGRTFVQFTARASDGAPGTGTIRVERCYIEDACIAAGDNYKGGSAMTVAGRHVGTIHFKQNKVRSGFARELRHLTRPPAPFGTGAFVAWDAGAQRNGLLILEDNHFEFAEGCGDRPLVLLSGCREVRLVGKNRFVAGAAPALVIDAENNNPNERFSCDPATVVQGEIRIGGKKVSREQLMAHKGVAPDPPKREPAGGESGR